MIASNHHYVVVYDLRSPSMEILDNRRSDRTLLQLYGDQIDVLVNTETLIQKVLYEQLTYK